MATKDNPLAPEHLISAAAKAREYAFLWNLDQYENHQLPLNLVVPALRKAYRAAEQLLEGYRV